jgi:hypothetical protein
MTDFRIVASGIVLAAAFMLSACYTEPTPVHVPGPSLAERFEKSWQAAKAAAFDSGVRLTYENRPSGTLRGDQGSSNVLITVITQADSTIQVGFSVTGGSSGQDASLQQNLTHAYQKRMGR